MSPRKAVATKSLRLSDSLSLPIDFATSRNTVLAQSGAGKSNVCVVLAEEMHRVGIPWIAIDTKGDWYGVRSSRDGKGRGMDVPVFGGEFGDMPLSPLAVGRFPAEGDAAMKWALVFIWACCACQADPPPPAPEPDHLSEEIRRLGEELLACQRAEEARLRKESARLDEEIAEAKAQIAVYRSVVGEAEYRRIVGDGGVK